MKAHCSNLALLVSCGPQKGGEPALLLVKGEKWINWDSNKWSLHGESV